VAHWLKDRGFEAYAVRGGVEALRGDRVAALADEATDLARAPIAAGARWRLSATATSGAIRPGSSSR
jgi:hypothetical protein